MDDSRLARVEKEGILIKVDVLGEHRLTMSRYPDSQDQVRDLEDEFLGRAPWG